MIRLLRPDFVSVLTAAPALPLSHDSGYLDSPWYLRGNASHDGFPYSSGFSLLQLEKVQNMAKLVLGMVFEPNAESHTRSDFSPASCPSLMKDMIFFISKAALRTGHFTDWPLY